MKRAIGDSKILLTGGAGFLGQYVHAELLRNGAKDDFVLIPRHADCDLREKSECEKAVQGCDIVIHLAGNVGGIGYNEKKPGELFYDNAIMGLQLMEEARKAGVQKFVTVGTVCEYPEMTTAPFREESLWSGYPEETNAPYGFAKKMLLVQGQAYRKQYGFNVIHILQVNLYGPGDSFDPSRSHVIPALIKKISDAKKAGAPSVEVWGTGNATREFLYVEDAARAIVAATIEYDAPEPVNVGSGSEISIKDLVALICDLMEYRGAIVWNAAKPDGQLRRLLNTLRARETFGFSAAVSFEDGLKKTIAYYNRMND